MHPHYKDDEPSKWVAPKERDKEHHGCFWMWALGYAALGVISALQWASLAPRLSRSFPPLIVNCVTVVLFVEVVMIIGILMWKRWAVYGLVAALFASFVLKIGFAAVTGTSVLALGFAVAMLWFFVRPNWEFYT